MNDLLNALCAYVKERGLEHDPGCPEDDTCTCQIVIALSDALDAAVEAEERGGYFVLDLANDRHALAALEAYSEACSWDQPLLADELNDTLARLSMHRRCTPLRCEEVKCDKPAVIPLGNGCWFCTEHAVDFHVRCHELGKRSVESLKRRGVEVPPGRKLT